MIRVRLGRAKSGEFVSCEANGHAGFDARGSDIVCSAVTVLLRTAAQVLSETRGAKVQFEAEERGSMRFCLTETDTAQNERLVCVADFLEKGICSIAREYPDNVSFEKMTV